MSTTPAPAADAPAPRRTRLRPAERREQIIGVAREMFVESGFDTTRVKDIAARAGITEAYVFRHFATKEDLFHAAVEDPLMRFVRQLDLETRELKELAERERASRPELLRRFHRMLLTHVIEIAPLLAAAMFSDQSAGRAIYTDFLIPRLSDAVASVISEVTAWSAESFPLDLLVEALVGIHVGMAVERLLDDRPIDIDHVAAQLTAMFAPRRERAAP
jgi:TetR/AcrR family transcriptional regulator